MRIGGALWADEVGPVAEVKQVDDDGLRVVVTFRAPIMVDVSPLWPGEPF